MATWHLLGTEAELMARVPFAIKVERHRVAVFHHDGRFCAISDICNHRGGPLSEGRLRGEFVMCPWHAWEYSVVTGKGPEGYDEEQVPVYLVESRAGGVYLQLPPILPRNLLKHKPSHLLDEHPKPPGAPHWADIVLISTAIPWGNASSLYYRMIERLNCIQNQITIHNKRLIRDKVAALIITGGQDNIQAVAGGMLTFWSELGFVFPAFPFIAHSRGWDAEDMQNNVRQVRDSEPLRAASRELADRALDAWRVLDRHGAATERPMERAGRKASPLEPAEEVSP